MLNLAKLYLTVLMISICSFVGAQSIDTEYIYPDSSKKKLIIQNSLPKGGIKYTAPSGEEFVYAIFWTRIINKTASTYELVMDFPAEPYTLANSINNSVKLLLPPFKMTSENEKAFNYGFENIASFLDSHYNRKSSIIRNINSGESQMFYVTAIYEKGVEGIIRAGLSLKNNQLFYKISGIEVPCGKILPSL